MKCAIPDCKNDHRTKGYCNLHYERLRTKGSAYWQPPSTLERFVSLLSIDENGCWVWRGAISKGYGYLSVGKKKVLAHRWSYTTFKGQIPDGLTVHHKCYNPSCVNPNHLKAITQMENNYDSPRYSGNKTHCPNGHEYTFDNTMIHNKNGGRQCRICNNERNKAARLDMKANNPEKYSNWLKQCHKK